MRLHPPHGVPVVEAQLLPGADRGADREQHRGIGRVAAGSGRHLQRVDAAAQPGGQHLPHGRQRPGGRFLDARAEQGGTAQRHGQRDRLLVVEQQRRQVRPRVEPVAAVRSLDRPHRVAELTQPVHVAAHGPRAGLEPLGEEVARPVPAHLQQ